MHVRSLYLKNFRRYTESHFEFSPSLNCMIGPNAQGKTSLLEALYYLMLGRPFRSSRHADLIQTGQAHFYLEAHFTKHGIDQTLRFHVDGHERRMVHNETPLTTVTQLLGLIQGVIMKPDDVNLIKSVPAERRQFLDVQIAQTDPLYVHHLSRYKKAIKQRNQLLKDKKLQTISLWEQELATAAAYITLIRKQTIEGLQLLCRPLYIYLADRENLFGLEYQSAASSCDTAAEAVECYLKLFQKNRDREVLMGHTLVGPHKDDLIMTIDQKDVRYFASEGEMRSCVAALHLAAWDHLKKRADDIPLWMVDDIGISLDKGRRERLLSHLSSMGQLFLTVTEIDLIEAIEGPRKFFYLPEHLQITP